MPLPHVSETIAEMLETFRAQRDNEVSMLAEVLPQYLTDHNNSAAYRAIDRQVDQLAKSLDRMIAFLEKAEQQASRIESSCENFYGE